MKILTKKHVLAAAALLVAGAAAVAYAKLNSEPKTPPLKYRASAVDTGSITHTVTATGTINPVALVNVGSQVSGTVVELEADFNDRVKQLLADKPAIQAVPKDRTAKRNFNHQSRGDSRRPKTPSTSFLQTAVGRSWNAFSWRPGQKEV